MARLILQTGDGAGDIGNSVSVDVIGTNAAETINVSANGKGTFDGSFSRGNDTISIAGNAANYSIRQTGSNQVTITNATGANLVIPVGTGVTIKFADVTAGRVLSFNSSNAIVLGTQTVTSTSSTVTAGSTTTTPPPSGSEIYLIVGLDTPTTTPGTSGADTFVADIVPNQLGEQANSLSTGDRLNGLDGVDTLLAHLQDASPLNAGPTASIAPITTSVEKVYVTADKPGDSSSRQNENADGIALGVEVNARRMTGVTDLGSNLSDTSLTFYSVNTLASGAVIGDESSARRTGAMTIRMERTGAATPTDDASNLTVLFDNDYLRPADSVTTGAELHVQMMDLDAALGFNSSTNTPDPSLAARPLLNNPYTSFVFRLGSETISIPIQASSETYAALLADFQAGLAADPRTAGKVTATFGPTFVASDTDLNPGGSATGTEILLKNSGPEALTPVQFIAANGVPSDLDFHLQTYNQAPNTTDRLIEVNVQLDKVGNGGDLGNVADDPFYTHSAQVLAGGGYLTIGGMQTNDERFSASILNNTWKNGAIANPGVEQFNIKLEGNSAEDSSLAGIQSTHNALRVINLTNPGSTADLIVGNTNTRFATDVNGAVPFVDANIFDLSDVRNNAIKDVLQFNAGSFTANSAVYGMFSNEVVAKYLNIIDSQVNPSADNAQAVWTFGSGNNLVNLNVSKVNVAFQGAATREDFELDINTNGGNDFVQLQFGDGSDGNARVGGANDDWYVNHVINAFRPVTGTGITNNRYANMQVNIDAGAGNDTVELWGSSAVHVVLGDGDDLVFTDNTAASGNGDIVNSGASQFDLSKAVWVFNSRDDTTHGVNDLHSQTPLTVAADSVAVANSGTTASINNLALRVTFQDIESSRAVFVANSNTAAGAATITDLQINQAIKDAINNDPVLADLLVAEDGPSGTLIVRSLVNGVNSNTDLEITLFSTTDKVDPGQTGHIVTLAELGRLGFSSVAGLNGFPALGSTADVNDRWYSDFAPGLTGLNSTNTNTNVVEGGAGNDTIVLSTDAQSTETVDINGVFSALNGRDTLMNFQALNTVQVLNPGVQEVQLLPLAPIVAGGTTTTNAGTVTFAIVNNAGAPIAIAPLNYPAGVALSDLAAAIANAINTAPGAIGVVTAAVVNTDDVRLTYTTAGDVPQSSISVAPQGGVAESASLVLDAGAFDLVDPGTFTVTFNGTAAPAVAPSSYSVTIAAGEALDSVGARMAATINAGTTDTATYNANTDTLVITSRTVGDKTDGTFTYVGGANVAGADPLTFVVAGYTQGSGAANAGVTAQPPSSTNGSAASSTPGGGYDIFDLTTVMGPVTNVRQDAPGNGAEPDAAINEPASIQFATTTGGTVAITDTLKLADFNGTANLGGTPLPTNFTTTTSELDFITAIAKNADSAATPIPVGSTAAPVLHSVVITVDEDNAGRFYHITNGVAAGDATVEYLGTIEMSRYDASASIGNWDALTITNFTPLSATTAVSTFVIA